MLTAPSPVMTRASSWSRSRGKRVFDFACALLLTVAALPAMAAVALLVAWNSGRPVLFAQRRSGRDGTPFQLLKFRTMRIGGSGPGVTRAGDERVTTFGRVLRKWKLDELPQLINVLKGDMSLVGPRPDLPEFVLALGPTGSLLLTLRPGLSGSATLHYRHEEDVLSGITSDKVTDYYVQELLPRKALLDLEYASRATFWSDFKILLLTVTALFRSAKSTVANPPALSRPTNV